MQVFITTISVRLKVRDGHAGSTPGTVLSFTGGDSSMTSTLTGQPFINTQEAVLMIH